MKYITSTDLYKDKEDFHRYSVSKIKTYKECSQMYNLKYVEKLSCYKNSNSTLIGTLLHAALEYLYSEPDDTVEDAKDAFYRIVIPEFKNMGITDAEGILGDLLDYNKDISVLYDKASPNYTGSDAIRTKSGKVPKAPEMTGVWKEACRDLDLDGRKSRIDYVIQTKEGFEEVSITEVFSKAFNLASEYYTPDEVYDILHLELPLSHWDYKEQVLKNPIPFPGCKHSDVYLNGYIDNVCKLQLPNGKIVNAVIDYKTSKEEFNENIVAHNQQLLTYAKGVEILLDIEVSHIGILHIVKGSSKLVIAEVDREVQEEVLRNYNAVIDSTFEGKFIKHVPDSKYSTCLNSFGSECPFLENCWPKCYEFIKNERFEPDFSAFFE